MAMPPGRALILMRICGAVVLKNFIGTDVLNTVADAQEQLVQEWMKTMGKQAFEAFEARTAASRGPKRFENKLPLEMPYMDGRFVAQRHLFNIIKGAHHVTPLQQHPRSTVRCDVVPGCVVGCGRRVSCARCRMSLCLTPHPYLLTASTHAKRRTGLNMFDPPPLSLSLSRAVVFMPAVHTFSHPGRARGARYVLLRDVTAEHVRPRLARRRGAPAW